MRCSIAIRILAVFVFAIAFFLFPSSGNTMELSYEHNGTVNSISLAETLTIILPGNPTTGYIWEIQSIDKDILLQVESPVYTPDSSMIGTGGKFSFRFIAKNTGVSKIKLIYHRPWEKDIAPAKIYEISIAVRDSSGTVIVASYLSENGEKMIASFDLPAKNVIVTIPGGQTVSLPAAISASGARYSNGRHTFWEHQGMGRFFRGDDLLFEGRAQ